MEHETVSQNELLSVIVALVEALKPFTMPRGWRRFNPHKSFAVSCWHCSGAEARKAGDFKHAPNCPVLTATELVNQLSG